MTRRAGITVAPKATSPSITATKKRDRIERADAEQEACHYPRQRNRAAETCQNSGTCKSQALLNNHSQH